MAHIVCMTTGLSGVLHASLEVVSRLEQSGHRVTYACPFDVRATVTEQGFTYRQLAAVAFEPAPQLDPSGTGRLQHKRAELRTARTRQRAGVAAMGMGEFVAFLREVEPDLLVVDMELHEHVFAAAAEGVPMALLNHFFSFCKRERLPPLQHDTVPGRGFRGSAPGLELAWLRVRLSKWLAIQRTWLRYFGTDRRGVLLRYARDLGFPMDQLGQLDWVTVFTYSGIPVLSLTAWEMEFPHAPRPEMHYVGPMVHRERKDARCDAATRSELGRVCADAKSSGRSILYASVTSMQPSDRAFLNRVIEAVRGRPDWTLVLGLGGALPDGSASALPENVHAYPWVPQLEILEYASGAITHGGIHTIHECVAARVPMLVYSGKQFDQNGNAARVAYHGLGVAADKDTDDPHAIRSRIDHVLHDSGIRERLAGMRAAFDGYVRDKCLETVVRKLVDQRSVVRMSPPTSS